jgi:hypothetical protein
MLMPNPSMAPVFACPGALSKQLDMNDYIDYDLQFEKSFVKPLRLILDTIKWAAYKRESLHAFFK